MRGIGRERRKRKEKERGRRRDGKRKVGVSNKARRERGE